MTNARKAKLDLRSRIKGVNSIVAPPKVHTPRHNSIQQASVSPQIKIYRGALKKVVDTKREFLNSLPRDHSKINARVIEGMEHIDDYSNYMNGYEIHENRENWQRALKIITAAVPEKIFSGGLLKEYTVVSKFNKEQSNRGPFRVFTFYAPANEAKCPTLYVFFVDPYHLIFPYKASKADKQRLTFKTLRGYCCEVDLAYHFSGQIDSGSWAD